MRTIRVVVALAVLIATLGGIPLSAQQGPSLAPAAAPVSLRAAARQPMIPMASRDRPRRAKKDLRLQSPYGVIVPKRGDFRRWLGMTAGAIGGIFLGGYVGARIEGDSCHCDDPGLKGGLIGAAVGGIAGGIAGAIIASR